MRHSDALIFDIDGTLWNASPASAKGWNLGLAKLGIDRKVSSEQIERVAGNPYEKCVDILLPGLRARYSALLDTLNDCEIEAVKSDGGEFFDGVMEGITQLASEHKIFLVSNCQEWYLNLFLDFSGFRSMLAGFDCHGMSGLPKNEMLSRIKNNHSLDNPVYIGDTASDETAAKLANIAFVYVSWGFGRPEGEPKTVHSFTELVGYLSAEDNF
jgi:phosphoglycolate phosphatase